jgi:malate synthase
MPTFLPATAHIRADKDWRVATLAKVGQPSPVELIGTADHASISQGMASGADAYIADFEDATVPTWNNVMAGHVGLHTAITERARPAKPAAPPTCSPVTRVTLRPRSWDRVEQHVLVDGHPCSAAIFDFAVFAFHNIPLLVTGSEQPCIYLAKLDSHLEARLWNDVFSLAQDELGIPRGTLRSVCDIETVGAAHELDEILYELREYSIGLHAGSAGYVSSVLRALRTRHDLRLPCDTGALAVLPCVQALWRHVTGTCHRRGSRVSAATPTHLPIATDRAANEAALGPVNEAVALAITEGIDVIRVAHPGLVAVAKAEFGQIRKTSAINAGVNVIPDTRPASLLDLGPGFPLTAGGLRRNCEFALRYVGSWLAGNARAAIFNRVEDAATFELVFALIWHWQRSSVTVLADGRRLDAVLVRKALTAALKTIQAEPGHVQFNHAGWQECAVRLERMCDAAPLSDARDLIARSRIG